MCEHKNRRSKRGKFDLGGVWMMVGIQADLGGVWMMVSTEASVSGSNFVNFCKFMLALLVLS
jgi:hypothetical protein